MAKYLNRSVDKATQEILKQAEKDSIQVAWDRLEAIQPQCGFGQLGICCTNCNMGPCRIDPFEEGAQVGVCGADKDTIVARNLLRHIAIGAAAHSDHGRDVAHTLALVGKGEAHDYGIASIDKLREVAKDYGISLDGKNDTGLAKEVALKALSEFGQQEGELKFLSRAPKKRIEIWKKLGIMPRGIDREIVESLHRVTMGVDNDYKNIYFSRHSSPVNL